MADFKTQAQADQTGRGIWVYLPVADMVESGSTFTNGNPGGRVVAEVEHFPGVGAVKFQGTVHLKQAKGKQAKASADPASVAAAVIAILQARGVPLDALLPGAGQAVTVPAGTTGAELAAGRSATAALLAVAGGPAAVAGQGPAGTVPTVNGDPFPGSLATVPGAGNGGPVNGALFATAESTMPRDAGSPVNGSAGPVGVGPQMYGIGGNQAHGEQGPEQGPEQGTGAGWDGTHEGTQEQEQEQDA